jgi:adenylate cyclase
MFIFVCGGAEAAVRHTLRPGETLVGRAVTSQLVVNDSSVSRSHARFTVTGDRCLLEDLGSLNGTYVNGVPITTADLAEGDYVVIGSVPGHIERSAEDQLALVDESVVAPFSVVLRRPVDQTPSAMNGADPTRLLTLISEVARSLIRQQPLAAILEEVVRLTLEHTEAARVFLVLKDEKTGALVPKVVRARKAPSADFGSISKTVLHRVMTDRVAMLASDAQSDERFDGVQSIVSSKIRAFMCAPLWSEDTTIGALYLDTHFSSTFTESDLELVTALSNYAAVAIEQARLTSRLNEETRRRERLGRYHSPSVVARIVEDTQDGDTAFLAQERDVTVLFADIVGFTTLTEHMPPQQAATLLNRYFGRMTDIVFEHEGTLDKFIGDAILAVFGAPLDQPDHAVRAIAAARAMQREVRRLNAETKGPPLEVRMALNSGISLAGDIGSASRRDYTVLGDVVNTASRIEASVAGPGQIVITRATFDRATGSSVRPLGMATLRGRREPIELFEVEVETDVVPASSATEPMGS